MKLYATVTSERASKGQGGNREIVIDLTIDPIKRKTVGRVVMHWGEAGDGDHKGYTIYYYPISTECQGQKFHDGRVLLYQEKGEKQKSENCQVCGKDINTPNGACPVRHNWK